MRIVFLGSPEYAVYPLKHLVEQGEHEVVGVVSQTPKKKGRGQKVFESPVTVYAREVGLKVFTPEKASSEEFLQELKALEPDLCVTCAYGKILTQKFLNIPTRGTINIHPSKLPQYRGAIPVPAALLDGLKETSVTILFTVKALDAGNIIVQDHFSIGEEERSSELLSRLFKDSCMTLDKALKKLEDPCFEGESQNESDVTHCKKIAKEDGLVDWTMKSEEILNRYRAFYPWPGSFTFFEGKRVLLEEVKKMTQEENRNLLFSGQFIFSKESKVLFVKTGDHYLEILKLKPEGKKLLSASDFWNQIPKDKRQEAFFSGKSS